MKKNQCVGEDGGKKKMKEGENRIYFNIGLSNKFVITRKKEPHG